MSAPPRMKMNVQFSAAQRRAIEELAEELDVPMAEVLKRALSLYAVALRERRKGNEIGVIRNDKVIKEIVGIA